MYLRKLKKHVLTSAITFIIVVGCILTIGQFALVKKSKIRYVVNERNVSTTTIQESRLGRNKTVHGHVHDAREMHSNYGHCEGIAESELNVNNVTAKIYFRKSFIVEQTPVSTWLQKSNTITLCNTTVKIFDNIFGWISTVYISPTRRLYADKAPRGGEDIFRVPHQIEGLEVYQFLKGFWGIDCNGNTPQTNKLQAAYNHVSNIETLRINASAHIKRINGVKPFVVAISRGDYANLWNHMFELYGVFLMMMVFHVEPKDVSILLIDGHPACTLDNNWEYIFGPLIRVGHLDDLTQVNNLIWGLQERHIPLSKYELNTCPYIEEFRTFLLNQYGIHEAGKKLNCDRLTFTFVVRRNQVYHPRNLEGRIERVIFNEYELIKKLMDGFPGMCIQSLLMESIPMGAQLEIISETDVLIGMHGAGMMHSTFIPPHSAVVELFPLNWRQTRKHSIMYEKLASWRNLIYESWQNPDGKLQLSERLTHVDVDAFYINVAKAVKRMCS